VAKDVRKRGSILSNLTNQTSTFVSADWYGLDFFSIQFKISTNTGTPTGFVYLQGSNDYDTWVDIEGSRTNIDKVGFLWEYHNAHSIYYRVKVELTSESPNSVDFILSQA